MITCRARGSRTTNFHLDRNTLCGLGAILIWSTSIALARSIIEQAGPITAAAAVYLAGGFFCLAGQLLFTRKRGDPFRIPAGRFLFGCGFLFVLYMLALYLALGLAANRREVLEVGLMNYLWPAFTLLLSVVLLKKRAGPLLIPGTLLAVTGVFLVLSPGEWLSFASLWGNASANPWPYLLGVVAALSWGFFSNLTRLWAAPENSGGMAFFLPATGILLFILRLFMVEETSWTVRSVLEILFLGGATAVSYVLWDVAMRKGDIVFVAACSYFTPLLSTLLSCLYLGVAAGFTLWLGCLLLVCGSLLSWAGVSEGKDFKNRYPRVEME